MSQELRIAFIGAGDVNFGGGEGPWDHASRLEKLGGVRVVGVADPNVKRAEAQLARRRGVMYEHAHVYADYRELLAKEAPQAVWIGLPPDAHGSTEQDRGVELACVSAGAHMLIEKPISVARPEIVRELAGRIASAGVVTSVGYMFRYAQAVDRIKEAIAAAGGGVRAFIARYDCAYSEIRKRAWWDVRISGGPIVEQATHFIDLARYLGGAPDPASVKALAIRAGEPGGHLSDVPTDAEGRSCEDGVPLHFTPPRVTAAIWRFRNGAIGSLSHAVLLHGRKYETELEVWGDGFRAALLDPYGDCRVLVRSTHSEQTEEFRFPQDDPYLTENRAFLHAIRSGDRSGIRSSYEDALKTYEFTWAIADAA